MNNDTGASLSDIAALLKSDGGFGDGYGLWVILFLIICCGWGGNGWGNNGNANAALDSTLAAAAAQGGYVTNNAMNDALRLQSIQQGQRDIVDAVNSNKYDIVNANAATESRIIANQASLLANQAANAQAQQACCSDIKYTSAMNTAAINENVTAQTQKVLDLLNQNKIEALQNQVNGLQLQNAMNGVVRYPMQTTYSSGANPFCGCGCGTV